MQRSLPPLASRVSFAVLTAACLALPGAAHALGLRIPNQDAEAIARGNAFTATADNPSAIYYNPAGITQLDGLQVQLGAHVLAVNSHYVNGATDVESKNATHMIPQIYVTYSMKDKPISFGLGIYMPYGLGLEWPTTTGFNTLAEEGKLVYSTINPVVAWKIHETLSLAVGPTFNYSTVDLRRGIGLIPGDDFRFRGEGSDFGFTAGLRWQPIEKLSFGLNYHSASEINYDGTSRTTPSPPLPPKANNSSGSLDFGQFAMAGVSYRPTKHWNVEANVDWTDWDTMNTATFKKTGFGNVPFPLNWRSSFLYEVGVSRYFDNGWRVSAGYFYSARSTTERDFNPILPDTDLHVGSLGFGWKGERWSWGIAAQIITGPERVVDNSTPNPISGQSANGKYHWFNQSVNFSIGYRFR